VKCDSNKPVSIALKEIAEGLVTIATPEEVKEMEKTKQK
jgi:DNA-directed RNA polymerase subunit omega